MNFLKIFIFEGIKIIQGIFNEILVLIISFRQNLIYQILRNFTMQMMPLIYIKFIGDIKCDDGFLKAIVKEKKLF